MWHLLVHERVRPLLIATEAFPDICLSWGRDTGGNSLVATEQLVTPAYGRILSRIFC